MRRLLSHISHVLFALSLSVLAGCIQKDDVGKVCGSALVGIGEDPIVGETPIQEVIRLERDKKCLSFQCLEHRGLPAYCTKECSEDVSAEGSSACITHQDCPAPQYCSAGKCVSDGCGPGYWCQEIQEIGPLAGTSYCVRRENCTRNSDCGALGAVDCIAYGCFDECLANPECETHRYTCLPKEELPCACLENTTTATGACSDADYVCQSPTDGGIWPIGSVQQIGICTSRQDYFQ